MNTKHTQRIQRTLRLLLFCSSCAAATLSSLAQTLVTSRTEHTPGSVDVVFTTTAGKNYRIEHSNDLTNWTFYPDSIYGLNQTVRYHVYDAPLPVAGPPLPPPTIPDLQSFSSSTSRSSTMVPPSPNGVAGMGLRRKLIWRHSTWFI